ncbi:MAG: hypothetical protein IKC09_09095 [Oscillospiraceae bacterium]|nr:hypothetical protein [Oscillospiraceae bacterium]
MEDLIVAAIESAEKTLGFTIPEEVWVEVLGYSVQKLEYIKKPQSYLPILFENELTDYYSRMAINLRGAMNYV